jgi:hypothetical protein
VPTEPRAWIACAVDCSRASPVLRMRRGRANSFESRGSTVDAQEMSSTTSVDNRSGVEKPPLFGPLNRTPFLVTCRACPAGQIFTALSGVLPACVFLPVLIIHASESPSLSPALSWDSKTRRIPAFSSLFKRTDIAPGQQCREMGTCSMNASYNFRRIEAANAVTTSVALRLYIPASRLETDRFGFASV